MQCDLQKLQGVGRQPGAVSTNDKASSKHAVHALQKGGTWALVNLCSCG
jgi:hypothetical protein